MYSKAKESKYPRSITMASQFELVNRKGGGGRNCARKAQRLSHRLVACPLRVQIQNPPGPGTPGRGGPVYLFLFFFCTTQHTYLPIHIVPSLEGRCPFMKITSSYLACFEERSELSCRKQLQNSEQVTNFLLFVDFCHQTFQRTNK